MLVLLNFTPFQPSPGLAIWSLVIFGLFWWLMGKFAFTPIAKALEKRENDIQHALDSAKLAKEEMANMQSQNEALLAEARQERSKILQEAKEMGNSIVNDAKAKAKEEASKIVAHAKVDIENQRKAALTEAKNKVGVLAIDIAEKLLRRDLNSSTDHKAYVSSLVDDIKLN